MESNRRDGGGGPSEASISAGNAAPYSLPPSLLMAEDVLLCVDVGAESRSEMRVAGPKGRAVSRLDAIKQALLLFTHAKLSMSADHRFALAALGSTFSWVKKELSSDLTSVAQVVRFLTVPDAPADSAAADLTKLFEVAHSQAKASQAQGRLFRLVLIYCRSSAPPTHRWPVHQKMFTMDVLYLHDKPAPHNCPQKVYDALVDAVEHVSLYEGYVFETGQGLTRILFRHISVLLSHPAQRCMQDDLDVPRPIVKRTPPIPTGEAAPPDDTIII